MTRWIHLFILALFAVAVPTLAQDLETEWIEPVKGYQEQGLGAEVRAIDEIPGEEGSRITLAIPKSAIPQGTSMEEIVVVGSRLETDKAESVLKMRHEWVADYDDDYYGLLLYLGEKSNLPIRLYLDSDTDPLR